MAPLALADGTYPYNTFVVPCAVEAVKLGFSSTVLVTQRLVGSKSTRPPVFTFQRFVAYAFPAFCYFVKTVADTVKKSKRIQLPSFIIPKDARCPLAALAPSVHRGSAGFIEPKRV